MNEFGKIEPCSEWDSEAKKCKSGHVGLSGICFGIFNQTTPPPCMQEERPNFLIREDGYPIGWPEKP